MTLHWFLSRRVRVATHMCKHVQNILNAQRDQLDLVARELLQRETLDRRTFYQLIGKRDSKEESKRSKAPRGLYPEPIST